MAIVYFDKWTIDNEQWARKRAVLERNVSISLLIKAASPMLALKGQPDAE